MTRRFHTAGQSRPHVVHGGYRYQSAQHARLERPSLIDLWRRASRLERCLSIYCIVLTVGVINYCAFT